MSSVKDFQWSITLTEELSPSFSTHCRLVQSLAVSSGSIVWIQFEMKCDIFVVLLVDIFVNLDHVTQYVNLQNLSRVIKVPKLLLLQIQFSILKKIYIYTLFHFCHFLTCVLLTGVLSSIRRGVKHVCKQSTMDTIRDNGFNEYRNRHLIHQNLPSAVRDMRIFPNGFCRNVHLVRNSSDELF